MATLKELMGDKTRGDGKKFARIGGLDHEFFEPIYLSPPNWFGLDQDGRSYYFSETSLSHWQEWTPPKQTKKVKMYQPIYRGYGKHYATGSTGEWHSDKDNFTSTNIIGWMEMEVEVEK